MAELKKENVTTTATSFSAKVTNIIAGEVLRFFLYYDDGTGNTGEAITTGEEFAHHQRQAPTLSRRAISHQMRA